MNEIESVVCKFKELRIFQIHAQTKIKSSCEMLNDQIDILAFWSSVMPYLQSCRLVCMTSVRSLRSRLYTDCSNSLYSWNHMDSTLILVLGTKSP
jgi:hypothetical protein